MVWRGPTGVLSTAQNVLRFEVVWSIKDFLSLSVQEGDWYNSYPFVFNDSRWCLMIIPNGVSSSGSYQYVDLHLQNIDGSVLPISLSISFSLKTASELKSCERHAIKVFEDPVFIHGFSHFISRNDLVKEQSEFLPFGILTVVCILKVEVPDRSESDGSLCQDYKRVLLEGSHHDFILRVGDREFRVHRDILKARSPVFWSMLDLDMKEKNSDSVDIPDCHPDAMEQFLLYIYSGKVEALDQSNMSELYYIADKYDVSGLKQECRDFIKKSLSLTNICEIIQIAMNHSDSILLEKATEYFGANMLGIMRTVEWQSFGNENFTVANELLMKCIEKSNNAK